MSNTFASTTNAFGILKIYYAGPIVSQFNDSIPLYKAAERGKEKWTGLQVNRSLKVRRNPGIGATSDGGALPVIGKQTTQQAVITARYNYLRFGVTGPMMKASQGDKGSFVSSMEYEMQEGLTDLKNDVNRQLFWTGRGDLAVVSAAAIASTVITVTGRTTGEDGSKYLDTDVVVDIIDAATDTYKAVGVTIVSVSGSSTATVVLNQSVTCAASDILVHTGAYNQEIQGIRTLLDGATSTVYGINRATFPVYNGNVVTISGQLQLDSMQQALNQSRQRGGEKVDAIFCDFNSERFYNKLLVADKRYIGEKVKGDGTFTMKDQSYLEFGGAPVTPDKDATGQEMYFMPSKGWMKYVLSDLEWADESGAPLIAQVGTDAYEARLRLMANMFPEKPSGMTRLTGYTSP